MHTLGYSFRPWTDAKMIADGPRSAATSATTADAYGVMDTIRCGHRVDRRRTGRSDDARWTVTAERTDDRRAGAADRSFLLIVQRLLQLRRRATSRSSPARERLRRHDHPSPALARGPRLRRQARGGHRQRRDRDHARAGDGRDGRARGDAPALADLPRLAARRGRAGHGLRRRLLPAMAAYQAVRWKNVALQSAQLQALPAPARSSPSASSAGASSASCPRASTSTRTSARATTPGTSGCACAPTGTSSRALRRGRASIVTDRIETFTETGVRLRSGEELEADIVVTATGLQLLALGGIAVHRRRRAARPSRAPHLQGDDARRRPQRGAGRSATPTPRGR